MFLAQNLQMTTKYLSYCPRILYCRHAMTAHGLAGGVAGQETEEIRQHLIDIDKKVHEVAEHLDKLVKGIEDIFAEMERDIKVKP